MNRYTSVERVLVSLAHREPDRVPFDLGATTVTGISVTAYRKLCDHLGIQIDKARVFDLKTQTAEVQNNIFEDLGCTLDVRGIVPQSSHEIQLQEEGDFFVFTDEWGVRWRKPNQNGLYFDPVSPPLSGSIDRKDIDRFPWPNPEQVISLQHLEAEAEKSIDMNKALIMNHWVWGIFETASILLRGIEDFYKDLILRPQLACYLMDRVLEQKMAFWDLVLSKLGDRIHVVKQNDDIAGQDKLLVSPEMYRKHIKPRHKQLFEFIKSKADVYIMFHTDGAVFDLIPDFIEAGADIINPVQLSARGMDPVRLKQSFGEDVSFWGAGIDTQKVLARGSTDEIRDHVRRNIEALAPGGGFIFSAVHNIQADTPPENILAMVESFSEYAKY
jgi:uroporphyrinogen decarboxylase